MSRPISDWNGFLGQRQLIRALRPIAEGAKANGRVMPPTLFTGPSGHGKSYLANAFAKFFGTHAHVLVARADLKLDELLAFFRLAHAHDVLFIDEIHALQFALQETIFGIIDHGKLPATVSDATSAESQNLPPLHLLAATDRPGKLLTPLKSRFALPLQFGAYTARELDAHHTATRNGIEHGPLAASRQVVGAQQSRHSPACRTAVAFAPRLLRHASAE